MRVSNHRTPDQSKIWHAFLRSSQLTIAAHKRRGNSLLRIGTEIQDARLPPPTTRSAGIEMTEFDQIAELTLRLTLATAIGGAIGLNRDMHGKPAGLRMLGLVALGASLATISVLGYGQHAAFPADAVSRVIQGVLAGVGFLGAGVIMRDQTGNVHRLNTAASVWVTAAIGVTCGLGEYTIAVIAGAIVLVLLTIGAAIDHRFYGKFGTTQDPRD
jgi:putative Mg2+ transporter-C (MgtC) family protein